MPKVRFEDAVRNIQKRDTRFKPDGYYFLKESLDYTVRTLRENEPIEHRHVSGCELLDGLKNYTLEKYGPMALPLLEAWGIRSSRDIGDMVFQLIREGALGKSEDDHPSDFENWMSFEEAFQTPFRPSRPVLFSRMPRQEKGPLDPPARGTKPVTPRNV